MAVKLLRLYMETHFVNSTAVIFLAGVSLKYQLQYLRRHLTTRTSYLHCFHLE